MILLIIMSASLYANNHLFDHTVVKTLPEINPPGDLRISDAKTKAAYSDALQTSEPALSQVRTIKFINPSFLISHTEDGRIFKICDVEGELAVLEKKNNDHIVTDIPVEIIILKKFQRTFLNFGEESIKTILEHKSFKKNLKSFVENVISPGESGIPKIFGLTTCDALDIIEMGSKITNIDPLTIIHPISGKNFITHIAALTDWKNQELLNRLIDLFPQKFLSTGQSVIAELLKQSLYNDLIDSIVNKFKELGGVLDTYHSLWIQVTQTNIPPDETFKNQFSSLSIDEKQSLCDLAYKYNNTFVYASPDSPITPDQYSINLIWINKNKIPDSQEFLFSDKTDFHNNFITPVSKWAKKNRGSSINIWVDSKMATLEAIERSRIALVDSLKDYPNTSVQFRDVRSIDLVNSNSEVFAENIPIYFRVDLLRAVVADYSLTNKETKFFVYGDIDMDPLSAEEIFDKKTVNYLNDIGFVMAKSREFGFENGFQILNGEKPKLMASHREVIIDLSIDVAKSNITEIDEQQVYKTYLPMFAHFFAADGRYGNLNLPEEVIEEKSTMPKDTYIFRHNYYKKWATGLKLNYISFENGPIKLKEDLPGKPVRIPLSRFAC